MTTLRILFFGDSFTACPGLAEEEAWPGLVGRRLSRAFAERASLEFQVSTAVQENTRGALERMQKDVQFAEPDIVTIQFGTNDSTHWLSNRGAPIVSQAAFRANLAEMIDRCRRFDIRRTLFLTNHPVALERFDINGLTPDQNTALYDGITREVAAAHGCRVADVRSASARLDPSGLCQGDLIHVNHAGAALYADTVTPVLTDLIEGLLALEDAAVPSHAYD